MAGRNFLFVPGPTNIPDRILRSMTVAMEDHRSSKFPELTRSLFPDLMRVFGCEQGQVFIFPTTGTGAWEAALANTLSPGERVLAPRFGQFSHLWIEMMQRLGLQVEVIECEWGEGAPEAEIGRILRADDAHRIRGEIARHPGGRLVVHDHHAADAVSSLGSIEFRMSEWRVDLAVTGSQKGLMLPAGLGIVCASPKALAAAKDAKCARAFFSFADMQRTNGEGYFPYTPNLPLLYGLRESLDMLLAEGLANVFARHNRLASGVREAVAAWGLGLCCKELRWRSDTVSAVTLPPEINGAHVVDVAFRRYNLALGAGLARVAGKVFRIGHLGDLNELMLLGALAGTEMAMADVGVKIEPGSGVGAAQAYWRRTDPVPKKRVARSEVLYASHSAGSINA